MNDAPDPLETELAAFRPADVSDALRRSVASRLINATAKKRRRLWAITLVGGLAAACVAAWLLGRGGRPSISTGTIVVGPPPAPSGRTDDALPSLRAYQQALARSPEDLDALLDRHAALGRRTKSQDVRIRAFHQPDPEAQTFSGEL